MATIRNSKDLAPRQSLPRQNLLSIKDCFGTVPAQQTGEPSNRIPQVLLCPLLMAISFSSAGGTIRGSCWPQHTGELSARSAQV